jgi:hypothetical protein
VRIPRSTAAGVCTLLLTLVFTGAGAGAGDGAAGRIVRMTATPGLFPAYAPSVHDYVTRCAGRAAVRITTSSAAGTTALIGGKARRTATVALLPGRSVTVEGRGAGGSSTYHVRCLPADFPSWQVSGPGAPDRWYVAAPTLPGTPTGGHYVVVFDNHGTPVWWFRDAGTPIDAKLLPGNVIAYATFNGPDPSYQLRRLDGTLVQRVQAPDGQIDDHELQQTADGNRYYLVYQPQQHVDLSALGGPADATVLEGRIEEISPKGKLLWTWSTAGHVDVGEVASWRSTITAAPLIDPAGEPAYDVYHANSISISGNLLLVSLRYANAVYAIDRGTGYVVWKLGGTPTAQSLQVAADPLAASPFSGQHDARLLPDGTITVFDDESFTGRAPRAVQYRIDGVTRTATLLRSLSDPEITASSCCGSARLTADGDWLVSWGGDPTFGEYAADGRPLLRVSFDGLFSYRVVPVAASRLPVSALRAGMDAMAAARR